MKIDVHGSALKHSNEIPRCYCVNGSAIKCAVFRSLSLSTLRHGRHCMYLVCSSKGTADQGKYAARLSETPEPRIIKQAYCQAQGLL